MKRSGDVTAAAVVMFCGSALLLLMGAFAMFTALVAPTMNAAQGRQLQIAGAVMVVVIYGGLALWGIATGVGILKLQPWARISAIVMSVLAIAGCSLGLVSFFAAANLLKTDNRLPPNFGAIMLVIFSVMFAIPAGIAIWWVILFSRKRVALEFATRGVTTTADVATQIGLAGQGGAPGGAANELAGGSVATSSGGAPSVASFRRGAGRPPIPISIRVIAVASIVFSAFGLLAVPFFFMGMMTPVLFFGFLVKGDAALVYFFAVDLLPLAFGIALLRRQAWSADAMTAFLAAMVVNLGMFYISPQRTAYDSALQSASAQMLKRMNLPTAPPEASRAAFVGFDVQGHVFQNCIFGLTMALYALVLFFLLTRRKAFRDACEK